MVSTDSCEREILEQEVQKAVDETGFGRFNLKVVLICGLIYMNTGFSISSVGLILPSAACDFQMTTVDKGRISAIPMFGMMCGSYFWSIFADLRGRRPALMASLFLHGGLEVLSAFIPNYAAFVILKCLSGFAISGQSGLVFTYLGEFQPSKYRPRILSWLELAWTVGLIVLPLFGWLIIPLTFKFDKGPFFFHSWNLFVAVCGLPSLLIGTWMIFFPETPKYLAETEQTERLSEVLSIMYAENTRNAPEEFMANLTQNRSSTCKVLNLTTNRKDEESGKQRSIKGKNTAEIPLRSLLSVIYMQTLCLFSKPYLKRTLNISLLLFGITSSYYTLMLWFPEMFQRYAQFENEYPGEGANICKVSGTLRSSNYTLKAETELLDCGMEVQTNVFFHTVILGLSCLPLSILLPLSVDRVGYKFYLISCTLASTLVTVGLFFTSSSDQNLMLSCLYEALLSVCMSIGFCVVVDIFPTSVRVMAAGFTAVCARMGALIGNSMFGYLIDNYCNSLIVIIGVEIFVCAILSFLISSKQKTVESSRL